MVNFFLTLVYTLRNDIGLAPLRPEIERLGLDHFLTGNSLSDYRR